MLLFIGECTSTVLSQTSIIALDTLRLRGSGGAFFLLSADSTRTLLGSTSGLSLGIVTDAIERLRVSSSGYIGIGTQMPSQLLEIHNGNILISNSNGAAGELQFESKSQNVLSFRVDTLSSPTSYVLPATRPGTEAILASDSSCRLYWKPVSALSNNGNTVHGSHASSASGYWIVPEGVTTVNVMFKGARGGRGGDADGPYNRWYGGAAGTPAFFSFTVSVTSGDTISFVHGANGLDGASLYGGWVGATRNAGPGTAGAQSSLSVGGRLILTTSGGTGGTGACGGCLNNGYHGSPGAAGTLSLEDFANSGILFYSREDVLVLDPASLLIRY
jgi:hypothetical protein